MQRGWALARSVAAALLVWTSVGIAYAQPAAAPPDIVRTVGGGILRGTIIEHDPQSHVRILLVTGEERRVEAREIEWAGPAAEMPSGAPATVPPPPGPVPQPPPSAAPVPIPVVITQQAPPSAPVRFESNRPGVHMFIVAGEAPGFRLVSGYRSVYSPEPIYDHLCELPCERRIALGTQNLGMSFQARIQRPRALGVIDVDGPLTVRIDWVDRELYRIIGGFVWGVGSVLGLVTAIGGGVACGPSECTYGLLTAGMVTFALSFGVGIGLAFWSDSVRMDSAPATSRAP